MQKKRPLKIPTDVARKLGYYVYIYIDPRNRRPFYVGKGKDLRALVHLTVRGESAKAAILRRIRRAGFTPQIEILAHGLPDENTAFRIEAAVIDALGRPPLVNKVKGVRSLQYGRMPLRKLLANYRLREARIVDPVILIRINRLYSPGMPKGALYEATRGVWKLSERRAARAKYALAVFEGIVCEVYEINKWLPAGSSHYRTRRRQEVKVPGRLEFAGRTAPESTRRRYMDHSVRGYLPRGLQAPVVYVNC